MVGYRGAAVPAMMGAARSTGVPQKHQTSVSSQEDRVKEISNEGPQGGSKYIKDEILPSLLSDILTKHLQWKTAMVLYV